MNTIAHLFQNIITGTLHCGISVLMLLLNTQERSSQHLGSRQNALMRAYSKHLKDGKTRIRLEHQEYPNKSLADAVMDKLSSSSL